MAMKSKLMTPNLTDGEVSKMSIKRLIDTLGAIRAITKPLDELDDKIREQIVKKAGGQDRLYQGDDYVGIVAHGSQSRLIADKVREILTEKQIAACTTKIPRVEVSVRAKPVTGVLSLKEALKRSAAAL